jgi:hypothetical protein
MGITAVTLANLALSIQKIDYTKDGQKIAKHPSGWSPTIDANSQGEWQVAIGKVLGKDRIVQASNSLTNPPAWGAAQLLGVQNATAVSYIKTFSHHNYPGGDIKSLMSHVNIARNVNVFREDIKKANGIGREYVFGETNSGLYTSTQYLRCHLTYISNGWWRRSSFAFLWRSSLGS